MSGNNQQNNGKGNNNQGSREGVSLGASYNAASIGNEGLGNYLISTAANAIGMLAAIPVSFFAYRGLKFLGVKWGLTKDMVALTDRQKWEQQSQQQNRNNNGGNNNQQKQQNPQPAKPEQPKDVPAITETAGVDKAADVVPVTEAKVEEPAPVVTETKPVTTTKKGK